VGGLLLGLACIIGSFMMEGGRIMALFNAPAMIIIFGGTIATGIIGLPWTRFLDIPKVLRMAVQLPAVTPDKLINELVSACEKARRDGLLALQHDVANMKHPFAQKYMRLFINGTDAAFLEEAQALELENLHVRHANGAGAFNKMGGYAPTMGIIGTVLGLITTLAAAGGDPTHLIHAIAVAFTATLWGVFLSNAILLPIGDRLKNRHADEMLLNEIATQGVFAIHKGYSPRLVRSLLQSTLAGSVQRKAEAAAPAAPRPTPQPVKA
jgi:chemotaxis protein MotA